MSAIAAVLGGVGDVCVNGVDQVTRMLEACARGCDDTEMRRVNAGAIGVSRHAWESVSHLSGPIGCVESSGVVAVADATLYYDADLRASLKSSGVAPASVDSRFATSTHRVLEAYRAWGADAASHLEGDFAFAIWDDSKRRLVASRSFSGKRPLYFWEGKGVLAVASTIGGVLASSDVDAPLEMSVVGWQAAGLSTTESETPFRGILALRPGETLLWEPDKGLKRWRHWLPGSSIEAERLDFDDAAVELRRILVAAAGERLSSRGPTAVWMSGGRDSTSVFAAGQSHIRGSRWRRIRPVSWDYPEGDPGRETEWIDATARRWSEFPTWLNPYSVPLFGSREGATRLSDEPFVHLFETWNRALAHASWQSAECRVALDGNGGDQLFAATPHALSDYFVTGRWAELKRQWNALGNDGANLGMRAFLDTVVRPAVPRWLLAPLGAIRGRPIGSVVQRHIPSWIRAEYASSQQMLREQRTREWEEMYAGPGRVARSEIDFFFRSGEVSRYHAMLSSFALDEGVELRSPLSDGRLVQFAYSRPLAERLDGSDGKRLLRAAMNGLVPESVLAKRPSRTGTTRTYFVRSLLAQAPDVLRGLGAQLALSDAGIVDGDAFRKEWNSLLRAGEHPLAVQLYRTLQAELWLRERVGYQRSAPSGVTKSATKVPTPVSSGIVTTTASRTELISSDATGWFPARSGSKRSAGILAS